MDTTSHLRVQHQDEVSLIDLWVLLVRRKHILFAVFIFCLIATVVVASLRDKQYLYATSVEIGSFYEDQEQLLIDTPDTVVAKLQEGYIPLVLDNYYASTSVVKGTKLTVRAPKQSQIVVIEAKGTKEMAATLKTLESKVVDLLKQDHARTIDVKKKSLNVQMDNLTRQQAALSDQAEVLRSDMVRLKVLTGLVTEQLSSMKGQVADVSANRKSARSKVGDESRAMTLLMIDNEINQNRNRVAALEERLSVGIPSQRTSLEKALADNQRALEANQAEIARLGVVLDNIRETRAIIEPTASNSPIGVGKSLIVALGAILGLVLGVFSVFFTEFLVVARQRLDEIQQESTRPELSMVSEVAFAGPPPPEAEPEQRSGTLG